MRIVKLVFGISKKLVQWIVIDLHIVTGVHFLYINIEIIYMYIQRKEDQVVLLL